MRLHGHPAMSAGLLAGRPSGGHLARDWALGLHGRTRTPLPPQTCRCQAGRWAVGRAGPGGRSSGESPESKLQCPKPRSPPAHTCPESTTCCPGSPAIGPNSCPPPWAAGSHQDMGAWLWPMSPKCWVSLAQSGAGPGTPPPLLPGSLPRPVHSPRGRLTTAPVGATVRPRALAQDGSLCYSRVGGRADPGPPPEPGWVELTALPWWALPAGCNQGGGRLPEAASALPRPRGQRQELESAPVPLLCLREVLLPPTAPGTTALSALSVGHT